MGFRFISSELVEGCVRRRSGPDPEAKGPWLCRVSMNVGFKVMPGFRVNAAQKRRAG